MSAIDLRTDLDYLSEPFGSVFGTNMTVASFVDGAYSYGGKAVPLETFSIHPGAHVLHYSSSVFEGMKAHRQQDGSVAIFRLDDHVRRLQNSTAQLCLPVPEFDVARQMIIDAATANLDTVPDAPGSLYIRPVVFGTTADVGAAAATSSAGLFYVLTCPVGDYFTGGVRPLTVMVETKLPRTTPQFGMIKAGANYAMALKRTLDAKADQGADQVLFAPHGQITETGASNFFLVDDDRLITPALSGEFLHGVTRASLTVIANDLGYEVQERALTLSELLEWVVDGEVFLSGTAAVAAPVGTLVFEDQPLAVRDGQPGPNTLRLRQALVDMQIGETADTHNWRLKLG